MLLFLFVIRMKINKKIETIISYKISKKIYICTELKAKGNHNK